MNVVTERSCLQCFASSFLRWCLAPDLHRATHQRQLAGLDALGGIYLSCLSPVQNPHVVAHERRLRRASHPLCCHPVSDGLSSGHEGWLPRLQTELRGTILQPSQFPFPSPSKITLLQGQHAIICVCAVWYPNLSLKVAAYCLVQRG